MEAAIGSAAIQLALIIDFGGIVIVALSAIDAFIRTMIVSFSKDPHQHVYQPIRWLLGRRLTLALELLIASDIIRTAIHPTWVDLGQLATIVVLREMLNFTLNRDIKEAEDGRLARQT